MYTNRGDISLSMAVWLASDDYDLKFDPKVVDSKEINIMGHSLIELTPIYGGEAERHQASEEELGSLQQEFIIEKIIDSINSRKK